MSKLCTRGFKPITPDNSDLGKRLTELSQAVGEPLDDCGSTEGPRYAAIASRSHSWAAVVNVNEIGTYKLLGFKMEEGLIGWLESRLHWRLHRISPDLSSPVIHRHFGTHHSLSFPGSTAAAHRPKRVSAAAGLSGPVITKLAETWKAEQHTFAPRDLSGVDYVYLWADGIHVNIRLAEHKLCLLVLIERAA